MSQAIEDAKATVVQRQAQVERARASLAKAELDLAHTDLRALQDGKIKMRNVEVGAYVPVGQQCSIWLNRTGFAGGRKP